MTFPILVIVNPPPGDAGFWERLTREWDIDRPDRSLELLLGDLDLAARRRQAVATEGPSVSDGDDGFTIPAEQRLLRLARYRRGLARRPDDVVAAAALATFLADEPPEALAAPTPSAPRTAGHAPVRPAARIADLCDPSLRRATNGRR